jgi:ribose transport system substrate-binding protein
MEKPKTSLFGIILLGTALLLPLGCSKSSQASGKKGRVIGYTAMDLTNPFLIAMRDAIKEAVEARGDTLISVDGKQNQGIQNDGIEDMITQGIAALILNPVDSQSVQPALEACKKANIPVFNVDSSVADRSLVTTFISSNNVVAGRQCGEEILRLYPNGARICIIENPLAESVVDRVKGLEQAIAGTSSSIIDRKSVDSFDVVMRTAEDLLQANPDAEVFWGLNDDVSLVMLGAVESAGRSGNIRVLSVDGSPSGKTSIQKGGLYATAAQSPVGISLKAVECVYTVLSGGTVESQYSLDTTLITPSNVEQSNPAQWG